MAAQQKRQTEDSSFKEIFQNNYSIMLRWAEQITGGNREFSEDLLHETYLKLQNHSPTIVKENLNAYLYATLRNQYHSYLKKQSLKKFVSLSETGLTDSLLYSFDPLKSQRTYEQLENVCYYACLRKEISVAASLIIFRFFHGYTINELQLITKRAKNALEQLMRTARREITRSLNAPERRQRERTSDFQNDSGDKPSDQTDFLSEFRKQIFSSCRGICIPGYELRELYFEQRTPLDRTAISHIVACQRCLNKVNELLKLPPLSERHPLG